MISREGGLKVTDRFLWKRRVDPKSGVHYHAVFGRGPTSERPPLPNHSTHRAPGCHLHVQLLFTPTGALEAAGPAQRKYHLLPGAVAAARGGRGPLHQ